MFVVFLFMGCHSYVEVVKYKSYKAKDYITKKLKVYEPKELLYPIMDSIIVKATECPEYQNRNEKLTFFVSVNKGNCFGPEEEQDNPLLCLTVNYYSSRFSNHRWTEGIVYYKEYIFYIDEQSVNIFFKETGQTVSILCISPEKYQYDVFNRGDRDMFWWYRYKHGQFVNLQYGHCPNL